MTSNSSEIDNLGFWIGQQPTQTIHITYLGPTGFPEEGWHKFLVVAVAAGFGARLECATFLEPVRAFGREVRSMYETLRGNARLSFTESNLRIDGSVDRLGHVTWKIVISGDGVWPPTLTFQIDEDQTLLWNVSAKIESLLDVITASKAGEQ